MNTQRLIIKPLAKVDIPDIHQLNSFEEVARYNTIGIPTSIGITEKLMQPIFEEGSKHLSWAVRDAVTEAFIGQLGMKLAPERYRMAGIYYNFLPSQWGRGYATEAVKALLRYGFLELGLHRIEAGCAIANIGSIRVLEKLGMTKEGQKRKVLPLKTGWSDNYEFAILEGDL